MRRIIAIETKSFFNIEKLMEKLNEFNFKFEGSSDKDGTQAPEMFDYWASAPFHPHLYLTQEESRQWSIYPSTDKEIDSTTYNFREKSVETLSKEDVEWLQS
jgi:hypothetical protein